MVLGPVIDFDCIFWNAKRTVNHLLKDDKRISEKLNIFFKEPNWFSFKLEHLKVALLVAVPFFIGRFQDSDRILKNYYLNRLRKSCQY